MKRNQIIDTVYLIQREVWVDSVGIRGMRNEPSTTCPALEFITVKSVCAIHDKLKVVECALLSVDCRSCCVIRIGFVKPRKYALLFRSFEVEFPSLFGIGRFSLVFLRNLFPLAEGECGKANVNLAVFYCWNFLLCTAHGYGVDFACLLPESIFLCTV